MGRFAAVYPRLLSPEVLFNSPGCQKQPFLFNGERTLPLAGDRADACNEASAFQNRTWPSRKLPSLSSFPSLIFNVAIDGFSSILPLFMFGPSFSVY